ncbi:MAG: hypothetical protein AAFQ82_12840, partial [Myxococcota bacterium]
MSATERLEALRSALQLEQRAEEQRWRTLRSEQSRAERVARGLAVDDLDPIEEFWGLGGRLMLTLGRDRHSIS